MNSSPTPTIARPPLQRRSQRTLQRLLDALDRLLQSRSFESITVQDLARAAGVSTGAFYARFASKEDLLPELYTRFQQALEESLKEDLDPANWMALSADQRVERLANFLCESYENRTWLLRAMAVHSRRHHPAEAAPTSPSPAQVLWLRRIADCLEAEPSPWRVQTREQVEFAIYTAMTITREAILFPHLPMATALGVNGASMRRRLPEMLRKLLGPPSPTD